MDTLRIQFGGDPKPYPFFITPDGNVERQDFWRGNPERLLGFSDLAFSDVVKVTVGKAFKKPELAVGMYPIFKDSNGIKMYYSSAVKTAEIERSDA